MAENPNLWEVRALPELIAMAIALDQAAATRTQHYSVAIETMSPLCRGQSVVDRLNPFDRQPNAEVVMKASRERSLRILHDAVSKA